MTGTRDRAVCYANARAVLDAARDRLARDRAAGRLTPQQLAILDRAEHRANHRAAAA
ncbi:MULTISPECIES: hypothetical protein [unclassified Streptomyces]|uniref:hypothetical protein n=1 Tax=unclassified Streptomyces TaxID=2593676 RepID=UPI00036FF5C0|nr:MULTISPECIES: hypothetical protein [unclassified Streptomyces]MYX36758.1 hypothetical protein [Streptomyces sp. SID8377]